MSDYPRNLVVPTHINPWSRYSIGSIGARIQSTISPGALTWIANTAIYVPFILPWPYNVRRMFWANGSAPGGNSDIGIHALGGARLFSSGSTANVTASVLQYVTPSPDILLHPGVPYFLSFSHDSSTASRLNGISAATMTANWGRICGLYSQSVFPLPLQATFAAYTAVGMPIMGFTNTASGF